MLNFDRLLQNWLGCLLMLLVVAYHYIIADPELEK